MNIILFEGESVFLRNDERYIHIKKILKKGKGDSFVAGLINGPAGVATITVFDDQRLCFDFEALRPMSPLFPVVLAIGFPRPIQLKRLLRDVASLGVQTVWLMGTELGEKSYRESTLVERGAVYEALLEGCMQAGDTAVPDFKLFNSVAQMLEFADAFLNVRILLDVKNAETSLGRYNLNAVNADCPLLLSIGSERGWTDKERALFINKNFSVCSLGTRILRTETAATTAIALALSGAGFMDGSSQNRSF